MKKLMTFAASALAALGGGPVGLFQPDHSYRPTRRIRTRYAHRDHGRSKYSPHYGAKERAKYASKPTTCSRLYKAQ